MAEDLWILWNRRKLMLLRGQLWPNYFSHVNFRYLKEHQMITILGGFFVFSFFFNRYKTMWVNQKKSVNLITPVLFLFWEYFFFFGIWTVFKLVSVLVLYCSVFKLVLLCLKPEGQYIKALWVIAEYFSEGGKKNTFQQFTEMFQIL